MIFSLEEISPTQILLPAEKVCVIGSYVAQELFGSAQKAVSETLK